MEQAGKTIDLFERMNAAGIPKHLLDEIQREIIDVKAEAIEAKFAAIPAAIHRRLAEGIGTDDIGAALASIVMAFAFGLTRALPGQIDTSLLLREVEAELEATKIALREPNGRVLPAGHALEYAAGMLRESDPGVLQSPSCQQTNACQVVRAVATRKWPKSAASQLAKRARVGKRAAQYWIEHGTGMSADALAQILRSDIGGDVLRKIVVRSAG
ncbi:hypothetical protein [Bosea sp. (in: a-proteobacteria)]|uniref:hypothetical protein n=1 Tax=Bosea sp. (in: a-proteobacteria) TaxID=1871050 RepID=UPI001ACAC8F9|nr:hypothetical protein [Bosea sp. (in: a-proteobacteria)]MBN9438238.1 hypothetical protein [Bosea sp. (in: a-proteobacteria)]